MPIFFDPDFSVASPLLNPVESNHAIRVLRMKPADNLTVINGRGKTYHCRIDAVVHGQCELKIDSVETADPPADKIIIAIAPPKNTDRLEWFIEKATEIGADEILPFTSTNSERRKLRFDRLEKIVIAATKQSQRVFLPIMHPLLNFEEVLAIEASNKFIAHCYSSADKAPLIKSAKPGSSLILIGPEGDFSLDEIEMAKQNEFKPVSLGDSRLRTETAAMVACHSLVLARELFS